MHQDQTLNNTRQNIWVRGFFMLLMVMALQVSGTLLLVVAVVQFVMRFLNDKPNVRLLGFGRSLGRYLQQIADFLTFGSEKIPFPFNDWPTKE